MYENSNNYDVIVELKLFCKTHLKQLFFLVTYLREILNLLSEKQVENVLTIPFRMQNFSVKKELKEGEASFIK